MSRFVSPHRKYPQLLTIGLLLTSGFGLVWLSRPIAEAGFPPRFQLAQAQVSEMVINGKTVPGQWTQWQVQQSGKTQTRIGISDLSLSQGMGVRLLSADSTSQQPIEWFSDGATTPLNLDVRIDTQVRYLDITPLAEKFGWQVATQGKKLQITTPAAEFQQLRVGKQAQGDRWVLDLSQPTPWQVKRRAKQFTLSADVTTSANAQKALTILAEATKGLTLNTENQRLTLEFATPLAQQPRVWMLANPNRLVVDWQVDPFPALDVLWSEGLRWQQETLTLGTSQFPVTRVMIDPRQKSLQIKPILPNPQTLVGIHPLVKTAQQSQVVAAINGGYFNRDRKLPLGAIRIQNRWVSSPILNRGAVAWNETGDLMMGRLQFIEKLFTTTGQQFTLQSLNSGYVQAGIARYTSDWGSAYTTLTNNEIVVTVRNNQIQSQAFVEKVGSQSVPIPTDGYLLTLRSQQSAAKSFGVGTAVSLSSVTAPSAFENYPYAIAAGPLLINQGQVVLNAESEQFSKAFISGRAPRSAIARLTNGQWVLAAVQHRLGGPGPTLSEWAQLLRQMGAIDALNLDGGSSTSLYLGGDLINRAYQDVARVHNGIGVFVQAETASQSSTSTTATAPPAAPK